MSAWVWLFVALSSWLAWSGDLDRSLVTAVLAVACAVMRLRPGFVARSWRRQLDEAEHVIERPSLFRGE